MTRRWWVLGLALGAAGIAHGLQRGADQVRFQTDASTELLFLPSPTAFKVATLGYHEPTADLLWMRAVLLFGERFGHDPDPRWGEWLGGMIEAIAALDPTWRTPYFYGGTMLRGVGAIDASDRVFMAGIENLPDDAYFPFALGMNYYLQRDDIASAIHWIDIAAKKPGAPAWYRVASAGILADRDMLPAAIRFLEEQRETTADPSIHRMIDDRLQVLYHNLAAQHLEDARTAWRARTGRDITRVEELLGPGGHLPPDPFGAGWILGADGGIRSAAREAWLASQAQGRERALLERR
jgi:hypothetical protein